VAKNSPIKDVGELKDKQFAFGMHQSPYQFYSVLEYFKSRGFPVATLKGVSYHKDNLSVAQTVLMKFANAGVVTQTWWETAKDRTLDLSKLLKDELRVIGKTEPLPEYVWAVTESVPAERKAAVSKALTENLAKNQAALAGFAAQGFTPAGDKDMDAACARLLAIKNVPPAPLLPSPLVPLNPLP